LSSFQFRIALTDLKDATTQSRKDREVDPKGPTSR
jgi:hypothetical protein